MVAVRGFGRIVRSRKSQFLLDLGQKTLVFGGDEDSALFQVHEHLVGLEPP